MEDSTGITTYGYDVLNQLQVVTYPGEKSITYSYDESGNRATMIGPDGGITTYSYDERNMLTALENPFNERTTWQYDVLGRATTMSYANGTVTEYDYDDASQLTALRNLKNDRSVISIFTYSYDTGGHRTQVEEANGDVVTWSYDALGQLIREWRSGANGYDISYAYDELGNRLTKEEGGVITTYSYDAANQLSCFEDNTGITSFSYDENGNTTLELHSSGERVSYSWDVNDRLIQVELPNGAINTFTFDGNSKRRSIIDSQGERYLIWDREATLAELDSGGNTISQYTHSPSDYGKLISQHRSGSTSFHHFDVVGSTRAMSDSMQSITDTADYSAFGAEVSRAGTTVTSFRWLGEAGYYKDVDTSLYLLRARHYNSAIARMASKDNLISSGESLAGNLYHYVQNNPISLFDPSGKFADVLAGTALAWQLRLGDSSKVAAGAALTAKLMAVLIAIFPVYGLALLALLDLDFTEDTTADATLDLALDVDATEDRTETNDCLKRHAAEGWKLCEKPYEVPTPEMAAWTDAESLHTKETHERWDRSAWRKVGVMPCGQGIPSDIYPGTYYTCPILFMSDSCFTKKNYSVVCRHCCRTDGGEGYHCKNLHPSGGIFIGITWYGENIYADPKPLRAYYKEDKRKP